MRFQVLTAREERIITRQLPPLQEVRWVRPCFLVSSREPGMAGLCKLQVRAQVAGSGPSSLSLEQEILITDGRTLFAPGTEDAVSLGQISAFELRLKGETIGVLSLSPVPVANFTAEGGFKPPPDFTWSVGAEEELGDRLGRLLERRGED
jgi:hypothetical protein